MQKNKQFEKMVHLFGFNIGIYYDARTYGCQKKTLQLCKLLARNKGGEISEMDLCFLNMGVNK
jgi:hypothetical protein